MDQPTFADLEHKGKKRQPHQEMFPTPMPHVPTQGHLFGKMNKFGTGNAEPAKTKFSHLHFGISTILWEPEIEDLFLIQSQEFLQADVYERLTHMATQAGAEPGQFLTQANLA